MRDDDIFQEQMLQGVSRTFALTIPELPDPLRAVVGNAYLLCRIADTIEDEPGLNLDEKYMFSEQFIEVVNGRFNADSFAQQLAPKLSEQTPADEQILIENTPRVIRITHSFNEHQIRAMERCVNIMSRGMIDFQQNASLEGLSDIKQLDQYCYYVAGVVGEMLTDLFCDYSAEMGKNKDAMLKLAVSFGQGLQMTNILMDIWDDRIKGACWLPRDVFHNHNASLDIAAGHQGDPNFAKGILTLVEIARGHLKNALQYILMIPAHETGIRRHCLMALGMAVLTLRRIHANPNFSERQEVKISRRSVYAVSIASKVLSGKDRILQFVFRRYLLRFSG